MRFRLDYSWNQSYLDCNRPQGLAHVCANSQLCFPCLEVPQGIHISLHYDKILVVPQTHVDATSLWWEF